MRIRSLVKRTAVETEVHFVRMHLATLQNTQGTRSSLLAQVKLCVLRARLFMAACFSKL